MELTAAERYASGGPGREVTAANAIEAFEATVERVGDEVSIRTLDDAYSITWLELRDRVHAIAGGLAGLGVAKSDTVAILLNNRPEFIPADLAAFALGAVPFSIYQTSSVEQIEYLISDSVATVAIVEQAFVERLERDRKSTRLNSSHRTISYAVFCLKKKKKKPNPIKSKTKKKIKIKKK